MTETPLLTEAAVAFLLEHQRYSGCTMASLTIRERLEVIEAQARAKLVSERTPSDADTPLTPEEELRVRAGPIERDDEVLPDVAGLQFLIDEMQPWSWLVRRLLATLDAARSTPAPAEGLDVTLIPATLRATFPTRYAASDSWTLDVEDAERFIAEYARLSPPPDRDAPQDRERLLCQWCGDALALDEIVGHLASEGREIPRVAGLASLEPEIREALPDAHCGPEWRRHHAPECRQEDYEEVMARLNALLAPDRDAPREET